MPNSITLLPNKNLKILTYLVAIFLISFLLFSSYDVFAGSWSCDESSNPGGCSGDSGCFGGTAIYCESDQIIRTSLCVPDFPGDTCSGSPAGCLGGCSSPICYIISCCNGPSDPACQGGGGSPTPTPIGGASCSSVNNNMSINSVTANPSSGNAPLNSTITGNVWVTGGLQGTTATVYFDCTNDDTWDFTSTYDIETPPSYVFTHDCSYSTGGTYTAEFKVEGGGKGPVCGTTTVTVTVPTLTVDLSPNPSSGPRPLNVTLTADTGGTVTGTMNYNFWWFCNYLGTSVSEANSQCGTLTTPASGTCVETPGIGYKCNAVNTDPKSAVPHAYLFDSYAKVIVERSSLAAQDREFIDITNASPVASFVRVTEPNYCAAGPSATISWAYSDPDGNPQSAYQVQIDDTGSAWNTPLFDSGKVISSGTSFFQSGLAFNVTYKTRVRVWDSLDLVGSWTEMSICNGPGCLGDEKSWKTPKHAYPAVDFTWSPLLSPSANQPIQFTDLTQFFNDDSGAGQRAWNWLFNSPNASPASTLQNPSYTYASAGSYNVSETVTDKDGYICARTKPLGIQRPIPIWKEVSPK